MTTIYPFPVHPAARKLRESSGPIYTASWGPHLCAACCGAGYIRHDVPFGHANFGKLTACTQCDRHTTAELARCWEASDILHPQHPVFPTLDSFLPHDAPSTAMWAAACAFAGDPVGWLTVHGNGQQRQVRNAGHYGAGKSHLAQGVARALLARGIPALLMTAPTLFEYIGAVYPLRDDIDYTRRMQWVCEVPVLIIDELNKESETSGAAYRKRFHLLNTRYGNALAGTGGATVLLSNDHPDAWQDPAIASRARDERFTCLLATPVDYRRIVAGGAA